MAQTSTAKRNIKIVNFFARCLEFVLAPLGLARRTTFLSILSERIVPIIEVPVGPIGKNLKFWGFGGWSAYRGRSVLQKEPLTINWLNSFSDGDVFWDVGANVGVYSIYAAARGHRTVSFEPSLANTAIFTRNIELNKLDHLIDLLPIALGDSHGLGKINMVSTAAGNTGAQASMEESDDSNIVFNQTTQLMPIDVLLETYNLPLPTHLKVDVDGIEPSILRGAQKLLASGSIKSIMIESNSGTENSRIIDEILLGHHFEKQTTEKTTQTGSDKMQNALFRLAEKS